MKRRRPELAPFEGVIVDTITPRRAEEHSIDLGATLELIDYLAETGATAIALLTSLGEFVHFALEDRRHMVSFAAKRSRLPLLVNVTHSTLDGTIELARAAAGAGVRGLILMPPYYFHYGQETLRPFFLACAAAIGDASPIFLSNDPEFTSDLEPATAAGLLATGLFAGIIESSPRMEAMRRLAEETREVPFTLLAGRDRLYSQARDLGGRGVVSAVACAVPELVVALDRAINSQDQPRISRLEAILAEFLVWLDKLPPAAAIKEAVRERKIKAGAFATRLSPDQERELAEFREWFRSWLPGVRQACAIPK